MSRTSLCLALLAAVLSPGTTFAQHHHHTHVQSYTHHHHTGTWNYGTHHHHTNYVTQHHHHQHNWNYVAPYHAHYHNHYHNRGTYYVSGGNYYFTPTVVLRTAAIGLGPVTLAGGPIGMGAPLGMSGVANVQPPQMAQPVQLQYGAFAYHQDLGGRLEAETNAMCLDLHYNYQQNPGYAAVYRAAYEILQAAKYVHAQEHLGNRDEIRRHVSDIDNLFHTVQTELPRLTRTSYKQIAIGDVVAKSHDVEALLHHLAYDVGVELHGPLEEAPAPPGFFAPGSNVPSSNGPETPSATPPQPPLAVPDLPKT